MTRAPRVAFPGAGTHGPALGLQERARAVVALVVARRVDLGRLLEAVMPPAGTPLYKGMKGEWEGDGRRGGKN